MSLRMRPTAEYRMNAVANAASGPFDSFIELNLSSESELQSLNLRVFEAREIPGRPLQRWTVDFDLIGNQTGKQRNHMQNSGLMILAKHFKWPLDQLVGQLISKDNEMLDKTGMNFIITKLLRAVTLKCLTKTNSDT